MPLEESRAWLDAVRAHPEVRRLIRALALSQRFHLYVLVCSGPSVARAAVACAVDGLTAIREATLRWLPDAPGPITREVLTEQVLVPLTTPRRSDAAHATVYALDATASSLYELWSWCLQRMNERRNQIARSLRGDLVLCVSPALEARLTSIAPDLWSIRSGTFAVAIEAPVSGAAWPEWQRTDRFRSSSEAEAERTRAEAEVLAMRARAANGEGEQEAGAIWFTRMGDALQHLGRFDEAHAALLEAEAILTALCASAPGLREHRRNLAEIRMLMADLAIVQGRFDEAAQLLTEGIIPEFVALEDVRGVALARGRIADILAARGQFDEALRIRRDEEVPVYMRLGDERELAVARGQIADILMARGELDEALRIRRDEEIPVYVRLGDVRSLAIAQGKVADVLAVRGEFDEALRIRREEQLPALERLGDLHSLAVARGKIADVLEARGELDEALRIRRDDEIPVYIRLGDVRSLAIAQGKVADILEARGEFDEALRIRREEQLPVFARLGDVRSHLIARVKLAALLQQLPSFNPGRAQEIALLLRGAYADAKRLQIREAEQIRNIMERFGLPPEGE